jgi:amino acid permease
MYKKEGHTNEYRGFFGKYRIWIAIFTLVGTIVGAGILGIPYVVAKSGVFYGLVLILLIGIAFLFLNLFAGEIILRTKKQHQLTGYAEKYLGKHGKRIMAFSMFVNIYGALIAYLIGEGTTLKTIFGFGEPLSWTLIFFAVSVFIIYRGIKTTGKMEFYLISLLLLVVVLIGIFSFKNINGDYFSFLNWGHLFLPYGVILFAFIGSPGIPEMHQELGKEKKKMKKAIIIGSVIPIVLYAVFALIIVGVVGLDNFSLLEPNERIATVALSLYSNRILGIFANILAVLSMFTSFLTLGLALVQTYHFDLKFPRNQALILTFSLPLIVALLNLTSFIAILGITGAIAGGLDGILITLMYWKAKRKGDRKPEYQLKPHYILGTVLIMMFIIGIGFQIWQVIF